MKALVLAGGHGTRLRPLTFTFSKQLIPVANKPVLFYALEDIQQAGITDVIINVAPYSKKDIMDAVGDGSNFKLKIKYNEQDEPRGIAHAVKIARNLINNEPFVLYLGDNIFKEGIKKLVEEFEQTDNDCMILLSRVKNPERFGVVEMDEGRVVKLIEKPTNPTSDLAMVGIYFFKQNIFDSIEKLKPSWRNELEIVEAIQNLVDWGFKVKAKIVEGWWKDTGKPEDLLEANRLILDDIKYLNEGNIEDNVKIEGKIKIGKGTIIKTGTVIRGPTIIGENSEIGPMTYIGPYTSVGANVIIRGGEIEHSIIMEGARIFSKKRIIDSIVGKNSFIDAVNEIPNGHRLIIGEKSYLSL